MAVDLQVCFPQEAINLTYVQAAQGTAVPSLDIQGEDFTAIDEVLINDVVSPSVMVLSKTRLLAQVPDAVLFLPISAVRVVSRRLVFTERSYITFQLGDTPSKATGILRLTQLFLKILFTTPGSDIFSPKTGAGALKNVGKTFGAKESGGIVSDFVLSVALAQRQIISIQARDPAIPRDERLLAAKVASAGFNKNEASLIVSVELTSQAGRAVKANVVL